MHYPAQRCLFPPHPKFLPETLPPHPKFLPEPLPPHPEAFANTCHPLSVTKSPAPRWPSCPQAALSPPGATRLSPLPCQPLVQQCLVLRPERGDTARLLLLPKAAATPQSPRGDKVTSPRGDEVTSPRGDKRRAARSLPPCAPRCPEPRKLRHPPCALRSAASCRGQCRSRKVAEPPQRRAEPAGGYSAPLRGVTECPPQPGPGHACCLRELLAQHRCSRGYPTQECVARCPPEPAEVAPECRQRKEVTAEVAPEVIKARSSAQLAGKPRCAHPRSSPRPSRLAAAGAKRSAHGKKSRCASRWLW